MTLTELIAEMEADPKTVKVLQERHTGHVFCRVFYILDASENVVREQGKNIILALEREKTDPNYETTTAYYEADKPVHMKATPAFLSDLNTKIAAVKVAQPDFKFHTIVALDNDEEKAIIDTYWETTGQLTKKQYGAWRKADTSIDFMEIV